MLFLVSQALTLLNLEVFKLYIKTGSTYKINLAREKITLLLGSHFAASSIKNILFSFTPEMSAFESYLFA